MSVINQNAQTHLTPAQELAIDEIMIPFRGRVTFRQYITSKHHKYGIGGFKLCSEGGYTYKMQLYKGKEYRTNGKKAADNVVMDLMEKRLDIGHILHVDNWYTSISLANKLKSRQTYLTGSLRKNRLGIPYQLRMKALKRGECMHMWDRDGLMITKWKDKNELYMISSATFSPAEIDFLS